MMMLFFKLRFEVKTESCVGMYMKSQIPSSRKKYSILANSVTWNNS